VGRGVGLGLAGLGGGEAVGPVEGLGQSTTQGRPAVGVGEAAGAASAGRTELTRPPKPAP
jgi:hypothetical protein